jgi:hypothetical protein
LVVVLLVEWVVRLFTANSTQFNTTPLLLRNCKSARFLLLVFSGNVAREVMVGVRKRNKCDKSSKPEPPYGKKRHPESIN